MNREQLNKPAAQVADDEIQLPDQIPERTGRWDRGITGLVQQLNSIGTVLREKPALFIGPELPHKCIIDDITAAGIFLFDIDGNIGTRNPYGILPTFRNEHCLGLEMTDIGQRKP